MLYIRMLLMMVVSLYTSRVVLATLGVTDFGIYGVVGGIVSMFSFLNNAMASGTQRFLTFELGRQDFQKLNRVFNMSVNIHILFAFVVFLLSETVGLWFLFNKMVFPVEREIAAFWTFQFSVCSAIVMIISTPYNALIIARERMSTFAYISIFEVVAKLLVVYLLLLSDWDRLVFYSGLIFVVQLLVRCIYSWYCNRNFSESSYSYTFDKVLFKEIFLFSTWNFWGSFAAITFTQGLNLLLNMFFGPVINASRTIAVQVQSAVIQFSSNFQTALNPQITKKYANGELNSMHTLIFRSSKYSFILLFIIAFPIFLRTKYVLCLWLGEVPIYAATFVRLILLVSIIDAVANPFMIAASATGKIKKYQTVVGALLLSIVPISYLSLKLGAAPYAVFIVHLCISVCAFFVRAYLVRSLINMSLLSYTKKAVLPIFAFGVVASILPLFYHMFTSENLMNFIIIVIINILSSFISAFYLAFTEVERTITRNQIKILKERIINI